MGPGKDFSEKNGHRCLNGHNLETKRDIVMGLKGKMVVTHRATNALLTKKVLPKQKIGFLAKMHRLGPILGRGTFWSLPFFSSESKVQKMKKVNFCKIIREKVTKMGVTTRKNQFLAIFVKFLAFFSEKWLFLHQFLLKYKNLQSLVIFLGN